MARLPGVAAFTALPLVARVVLVGTILVGILALLFNVASDEPTAQPRPSVQPPQSQAGPQVPPVHACSLLTEAEVVEAMGVVGPGGLLSLERSEGCLWQPSVDGEAVAGRSVQITPGDPNDFQSGAGLDGVPGTPVSGIGNTAAWFGTAGGGVLSVVQATRLGYLFVRVALNRPDLDDSTRLGITKGLAATAIERLRFGPTPSVEVDLCSLVTDAEAEQVLGPFRTGRPGARPDVFVIEPVSGPVDLTQPADLSSCKKLILAEIYIEIQSGSPADFEAGANREGVVGQRTEGVGEDAVWYGGVPVRGTFSAPHEQGVLSVRAGDAYFRIVLSLPDVDDASQLETAKGLAASALGRLPRTGALDREPPDRSGVGFVDNLLAKEEAGQWTRGEGLVASLQLFAGERDASGVLRHRELLSREGTGIIEMANAYLADGPDDESKAEIARLLDLLVLSNQRLEAMAGIGQTTAGRTGWAGLASAQSALVDCQTFFRYYEAPGVTPCLEFETAFTTGDLFPASYGTYRIFYPAPSLPAAGWQDRDYRMALDTLLHAVPRYKELGQLPSVNIVFSVSQFGTEGPEEVSPYAQAWAAQVADKEPCGIVLYTGMQRIPDDHFRQVIAHELAHCFQTATFPAQNKVDYDVVKWREEGLAEYLSNVIYPTALCRFQRRCDLEWDSGTYLADIELSTTVLRREYENFLLFQHLFWSIGNDGIFALVRGLPPAGGVVEQEAGLAKYPNIRERYHEYAKATTDVTIKDTGGGLVPYEPRADPVPIAGPNLVMDDPEPFGMTRLHLVVDDGKYACIEYDKVGEMLSSWRPGQPGVQGSWSDELPAVLSGEAVVVVTTTKRGSEFTLRVTEVRDDPECEEPTDPSADGCITLLCGPSAYYRFWEQLPEWLQRVLPPIT